MFLYTIKNVLPMKHILKTLPSSSISNYIEMEKTKTKNNSVGTRLKMEKKIK